MQGYSLSTKDSHQFNSQATLTGCQTMGNCIESSCSGESEEKNCGRKNRLFTEAHCGSCSTHTLS